MAGPPLLVVITGPSGAGKDSVLAALRKRPGRRYAFPVNVTTRAPREGEREGEDYHFVSKEEFARMARDGELLEHAVVYGQEKGVPKEPVRKLLAEGNDVIIRTDVQGARWIKSLAPEAVTIFIEPPTIGELEERMRARGGDSPEQVELRLQTARDEMASASEFDHTVINEELELCVAEIEEILERERAMAGRRAPRIA